MNNKLSGNYHWRFLYALSTQRLKDFISQFLNILLIRKQAKIGVSQTKIIENQKQLILNYLIKYSVLATIPLCPCHGKCDKK